MGAGERRFVKISRSARDEVERLRWMAANGLPVPTVIESGADYLITSTLDSVDASLSTAAPSRIIATLAHGLKLLHGVPIAACPFDRTLRVTLSEARAEALEATKPQSEDIVFTHGDYCLPNVMIDPLGFVDCGRAGKADRYQDLALAARSIEYNLGAEWVPALWNAYGLDRPDERKLAFYMLLDEFF